MWKCAGVLVGGQAAPGKEFLTPQKITYTNTNTNTNTNTIYMGKRRRGRSTSHPGKFNQFAKVNIGSDLPVIHS